MRLNLAQALISPNELLMLDEPTNHLDLDAVLWLESWLRQREGTLILISHDREFLDSVTTATLHIESHTAELVTGNYSAFERWRAARLVSQQALHEKTQARRKELQGFVDRFRAKATKARQAQSRLKMLEKLGDTQAVRMDSPFSFKFEKPAAMPNPLLVLQQAHIGYGDVSVLQDINFTIHSGDRIGLLGINGAGKSTLIKAVTGQLALTEGIRTPAQKLSIGYFAQHQVDQLRAEHSPLKALLANDPSLSEAQARNYLGGFGFSGDQALQTAETLSGGERARLALALIVQSQPNLLLLDEPTNHLDINMREALADALVSFEGALLVISHDRTMLRAVVDELWLVADRALTPFDDDLDGYARWLAQRRAQEAAAQLEKGKSTASSLPGQTLGENTGMATVESNENKSAQAPGKSDRRQSKRDQAIQRAALAPLKKVVKQHEQQLEKAAHCLSEVRKKLGMKELYNAESKSALNALLSAEAEARQQVELAEELLLESMEALEIASAGPTS
jgi:ATP-binding cassette subfamily F protein 3